MNVCVCEEETVRDSYQKIISKTASWCNSKYINQDKVSLATMWWAMQRCFSKLTVILDRIKEKKDDQSWDEAWWLGI